MNIDTSKRVFSKERPTPQRRGGKIFFPADIRPETIQGADDSSPETHYSFVKVEMIDNGQDITSGTWLSEISKELKLAVLADIRWRKEIGGITLMDGSKMWSDRDTQSKLAAAKAEAVADPTFSVRWKGIDGWVALDATAIVGVANAVRDHVKACFDREADLTDLIDQDIDTDISTGWPA